MVSMSVNFYVISEPWGVIDFAARVVIVSSCKNWTENFSLAGGLYAV